MRPAERKLDVAALCQLGITDVKPSKPWPENDAYGGPTSIQDKGKLRGVMDNSAKAVAANARRCDVVSFPLISLLKLPKDSLDAY